MLFLLKKEQVTQCDSTCFIEINFFTRKLLPKKITFFCYQSNSCRILKQAQCECFFFLFRNFVAARTSSWKARISASNILNSNTYMAFAGPSGIRAGWGIEISGRFEAARPPASVGLPLGGRAAAFILYF